MLQCDGDGWDFLNCTNACTCIHVNNVCCLQIQKKPVWMGQRCDSEQVVPSGFIQESQCSWKGSKPYRSHFTPGQKWQQRKYLTHMTRPGALFLNLVKRTKHKRVPTGSYWGNTMLYAGLREQKHTYFPERMSCLSCKTNRYLTNIYKS